MELLKLVLVFAVMIALIVAKKPLYIAAPAAGLVCWLVFMIPLKTGVLAISRSVFSTSTLQLFACMYIISFMQSMIKVRGGLERSQSGLTRAFHNNWITCTIAPFVIGLLPAAPAVIISGDIIDEAVGDRLNPGQKATAASFFRHVSEAFMPTYPAILMALDLTGVTPGAFVIGMLPEIVILILVGCFWLYRGRVPVMAEGEKSANVAKDLKDFIFGIWPIIGAIILIVGFGTPTWAAVLIMTVAYYLTGKFGLTEVKPFFISSIQPQMLISMVSIYVFTGILRASNAIDLLPDFFNKLPIPTFLIFVLICFFGSIVAGSMTMTSTMIPVAMASIPGAGLPLLCLLMTANYCASQISPTHVCLSISADNFKVPLGEVIKNTVPILLTFLPIAIAYYLLTSSIF